ncbi:MAG: GFA family protein [Methyloceanibacter sp.]|jgi:hypothetical protein
MSASNEIAGRCLCGAVKFAADAAGHSVDACHCAMCRRWVGGPYLGLAHTGPVRFTGAEHIGIFKSSDWAERAFCQRCGTSLYWRLSGTQEYSFCAGTLDDQSALELTTEIFIDEKPAYYAFANQTRKLTGAEAMAPLMAAGMIDGKPND